MVSPVSVRSPNQPPPPPLDITQFNAEKASMLPSRFSSPEEVEYFLENFPRQSFWQWLKSIFTWSCERKVLGCVAHNQVAASEIGRDFLKNNGLWDAARQSSLEALRGLSPVARATGLGNAEVESGLIVLKIACGNGAILRVPLFDECFGHGAGALTSDEIKDLLKREVGGETIGDHLKLVVDRSAGPTFVRESIAAAYSACGEHLKAVEVYQNLGDGKKTGDALMAAGKFAAAAEWYLKVGDFGLAGLAYRKAEEYYVAAECYREAGKPQMAIWAFEMAGDELRRNGDELHGKGNEYRESAVRTYLNAAQAFVEAGKHDKAGDAYMAAGAHEKAGGAYMAAGAHEKAGGAYMAAGAHEKAGGAYMAARAHEKAGDAYMAARAHEKAGGAYMAAGAHEKAGDAYTAAGAHDKAGSAYLMAGRLALAELAATRLAASKVKGSGAR